MAAGTAKMFLNFPFLLALGQVGMLHYFILVFNDSGIRCSVPTICMFACARDCRLSTMNLLSIGRLLFGVLLLIVRC